MSLSAALPLPIVASPGSGLTLTTILQQSFGDASAYAFQAWLFYYDAYDLANSFGYNFSYWNLNSPQVGTWYYNGSAVAPDNSAYVDGGSFDSAAFVAGNDIGPFADVYVGSTWYEMITVDPHLINLPANNQEPTPTDIVNEAYRFYNFYGWVPNLDDCHHIASAVAAAVGATLGPDTGSLDPTQNKDEGFWRVVYRGSDPNPVANWHTLVQAGDIVRLQWASDGGPHTTTILNVNADGSMVVYDNSDYVNGAYGIGIHTVNYDQFTVASSITIYRLTTDGLYLQTGDDAGDTIIDSVFNDKIVCGSGNDTIDDGAGNDIIDGGGGYNTVCYSGNFSQYQITQSGSALQVTDLRSGSPDGSDQLTDIQALEFADRDETAPIATASDRTATRGQSFPASSLFSVSDAEHDTITKYALWDSAGGTGYWLVNGVVEGTGVEIDITAAQLAQTTFQSASGADHLYVRAYDGTLWGAWTGFYVTAPIDHAPVVTPAAANYGATHNQNIAASSLFSVSDADNDAITAYQVWDSSGGTGHWVVGGIAQPIGQAIDVTPSQLSTATFQSGSGSDHLWVRAFDGVLWSSWTGFYVNVPAPTLTVNNVASATGGQVINLANLVTITDAGSVGYQKLELWDSAGTVTGGQFKINGTAQTGGHEIDVTAANFANTVFDAGTFGGTDTLWAQLQQNDGTLSGWKQFSVTVPTPTLTVSNAAGIQVINLASLVTISDPGGVGYQKLELWDSAGTVAGGQFKINGVPQTGGHEIDVTAANFANTVFDAGTLGGTDTLWAQLVENDGTLSGWKQFSVTVPALTVSTVASAIGGQVINLANLVTISDPGSVGYQKLELWDSAGTVTGGQFKINGTAQTGGHEIDVTAANFANTVFDAGTFGGTDTLWAQLVENDGTLSGWKQFSVTVPTPTLTVHNDSTATPGQVINLSTLVTITDSGNVGYQKLELWDSNGAAATGQFVVNGVPQTGGHEIDVSPANVANTVFDEGTTGNTDTLWARLQQNDGTLTSWQQFTVVDPLDVAPGAALEFTSPYAGTVNFIGATGTLQLDDSAAFTGTVAGLIGADTIDFRDIGFAGQPTFSGTALSGSLSVTDGVHIANIELIGDYMATNFVASSDGNGGTSIAGVPRIGNAS